MSDDLSFLANFITEDIYLIQESKPVEMDNQLAEMPKEEVIETKTEVKEVPPVYLKPLPTEGNNLKHCLIFFESDQTHLEATKKAFLLKILSSVKRSLDDVLLINLKEASKEQIDAVLNEYNHRHVLVFASQKLDYMVTSLYEVKQEGKKFLLKADDLERIATTVELKKSLWAGLQKMFL
jgi:hypothetical protein